MINEPINTSNIPGEATPNEVPEANIPPPTFGLHDSGWSEDEWYQLLQTLIKAGIGSWKDVAALVLGHLNPSQVGTSLASSEGFKRKYGKGNTMRIVMEWVYNQTGQCADCGTRLELQADHIQGRETYKDPLEADFIENMTLRCRRCNVVKRPSHEFGGLTFLTAEAALMWILLVIRPRTYLDYVRMCRLYGMTMSDIRMSEAWAMAHWLSKATPPAFGIEDDDRSFYDLILWPDSAITRVDVGAAIPDEAKRLYTNVSGTSRLGFLTLQEDERLKFHTQLIGYIPFSTYDLGTRNPQALCIRYTPPDRINGQPQKLNELAPRNCNLVSHSIALNTQTFKITSNNRAQTFSISLEDAPPYGRLLKLAGEAKDCVLAVS
jgi:hypothetical protein